MLPVNGKIIFNKRKLTPYVFLLPILVIFAVFIVYPFINTLVLSFQKFDMGSYKFVGLSNYNTLIHDKVFGKSLFNTFFYLIVQVPVMVLLSLVLAVVLNSKLVPRKTFFRMSIFLPAVTALIAYSMVFKLLLNSDYGIINYVLTNVGLKPVDWLNTVWGARFSVIIAITWRWTGYNMIVMLAGIQGIPESDFVNIS